MFGITRMILEFEDGRVYLEATLVADFNDNPEYYYQVLHNCGHAYCDITKDKEEALKVALEAISKKHYEQVEARERLKYDKAYTYLKES